jgi:hypothetical protein
MESAITDNEIDFSKANKRPQILAALAGNKLKIPEISLLDLNKVPYF